MMSVPNYGSTSRREARGEAADGTVASEQRTASSSTSAPTNGGGRVRTILRVSLSMAVLLYCLGLVIMMRQDDDDADRRDQSSLQPPQERQPQLQQHWWTVSPMVHLLGSIDPVAHHHHHHQQHHRQQQIVFEQLDRLDQRIEGQVLYCCRHHRNDGQTHDGKNNNNNNNNESAAAAAFQEAWSVWNMAMSNEAPWAVVEVVSAHDVAEAVPVLAALRSTYDVPFTILSGGHNYAGWSTAAHGIVLSVRHLNSFQVDMVVAAAASSSRVVENSTTIDDNNDEDDNNNRTATMLMMMIATMGPGTRTGDVLRHGLSSSSSSSSSWPEENNNYAGVIGSAATVGMGGFLLGGGLGEWSRRYGLGVDNVVAVDVVVADGRRVTATPDNEYADLFWALRGAGQATLGVVTSYRYRLYPAHDEVLVVTGPIPRHWAGHALIRLGRAEPDLPRSIFVEFNNNDKGGLTVTMKCLGESEETLEQGREAIASFWRDTLPPAVADQFSYERQGWYQASLDEAEEFEGLMVQDWNGFLFRDDSTHERWAAILDAFATFRGDPYVIVDIELFGGAIAEADPASSPHPWRQALYSVGIVVAIPMADTKHARSHFGSLVKKVDKVWREQVAGLLQGTFVNYAMKSMERNPNEYAKEAWGESNLARLQHIKAKYDPTNVFRPPLPIPTV